MKLKVAVVSEEIAFERLPNKVGVMTFEDTEKFVHDLQDGMEELRGKERDLGKRFYLILSE